METFYLNFYKNNNSQDMSIERFYGKYKNILVTGGAGFIGGALIRKLLKITNANIYNLDHISYASDLTGINLINESFQRHFLIKTNLINRNSVNDAIKKSKPDIIFHLAAESHVDRSIDNPEVFIQSNIIGTFNLLESAKNYWLNLPKAKKQIFRFHHISTDEVFGSLGEKGKFKETTPYDPRSPYSASKASSDHLVKAWFHTYGLPIIITNCSNNYGPYQFPEKLIPVIIQKILNKKEIPIYGDGKYTRDWLYVEDHVDGLILACTKGKVGNTYCIGGHGERNNIEIVQKICELIEKKLPSISNSMDLITYVKDRPGHDRRYSIDSTLISKSLDWAPKFSLEEGLELTVNWYIKNQSWCEHILNKSNYSGERLGLNLK